jgi:hypothetical protein
MLSNRGTIRLGTNWTQWHYISNPNPFPGNDGPYWNVADVMVTDSFPTSAWGLRQYPGGTLTAQGFDSFGFGVGRAISRSSSGPDWSTRSHTAVRIPHWFVALLLIGPSARVLWKAHQFRRGASSGLCPGCGYDLRASKDRCPECGREVTH